MYSYILYLFGFNNDYYKEPEVIVTPSLDIMEKKVKEILDNHRKQDMISQYQSVIDELKQKFKERSNKTDF